MVRKSHVFASEVGTAKYVERRTKPCWAGSDAREYKDVFSYARESAGKMFTRTHRSLRAHGVSVAFYLFLPFLLNRVVKLSAVAYYIGVEASITFKPYSSSLLLHDFACIGRSRGKDEDNNRKAGSRAVERRRPAKQMTLGRCDSVIIPRRSTVFMIVGLERSNDRNWSA